MPLVHPTQSNCLNNGGKVRIEMNDVNVLHCSRVVHAPPF